MLGIQLGLGSGSGIGHFVTLSHVLLQNSEGAT